MALALDLRPRWRLDVRSLHSLAVLSFVIWYWYLLCDLRRIFAHC